MYAGYFQQHMPITAPAFFCGIGLWHLFSFIFRCCEVRQIFDFVNYFFESIAHYLFLFYTNLTQKSIENITKKLFCPGAHLQKTGIKIPIKRIFHPEFRFPCPTCSFMVLYLFTALKNNLNGFAFPSGINDTPQTKLPIAVYRIYCPAAAQSSGTAGRHVRIKYECFPDKKQV